MEMQGDFSALPLIRYSSKFAFETPVHSEFPIDTPLCYFLGSFKFGKCSTVPYLTVTSSMGLPSCPECSLVSTSKQSECRVTQWTAVNLGAFLVIKVLSYVFIRMA